MSNAFAPQIPIDQLGRKATVYRDCPNCAYESALAITQTQEGRLLYHCHAGCTKEELWRAICGSDVKDSAPKTVLEPPTSHTSNYARALWKRSLPSPGTIVEHYLKNRDITGPIPTAIRYLPEHLHAPSGTKWPVMLASVVDVTGQLRAVHRTYLNRDGTGKAQFEPARMTLGPVSECAAHLGVAGEALAVAEGIETALSFQIMSGMPTWAALSAGGIRRLMLPPLPAAQFVTIAADADAAGINAAECAAERWRMEGRETRIMSPPSGLDFNDMLIGARL